MQVPETASNLNSGDCFVLLTPTDIYLWVGSGCSADESHAAEEISKVYLKSRNKSGFVVSLQAFVGKIGLRRPSQLDQYRYFRAGTGTILV